MSVVLFTMGSTRVISYLCSDEDVFESGTLCGCVACVLAEDAFGSCFACAVADLLRRRDDPQFCGVRYVG